MRRIVAVLALFILGIGLASCGERQQYGAPIDSRTPVLTLQQIADNPVACKDKEVVLRGVYGFYCCPTDFSYKEGLDVVAVTPQGFSAPKLKVGAPVALYGVVRVGPPPEAENEAAEKGEGSRPFYIEAKGMTLR